MHIQNERPPCRDGIKRVAVYNEELATTVDSLTGKRFSGTLKYTPPVNSAGLKLEEIDADYPFSAVTYKKNLHTQSRTLWSDFAMQIMPENFVEMNRADAEKLGVKNGAWGSWRRTPQCESKVEKTRHMRFN